MLALVMCTAFLSRADPLQQWEVRYPTPPDLSQVIFANGLYAGLPASGGPFLSRDGVNWLRAEADPAIWDDGVSSIAFGNGAFFCVTFQGEVVTSSDATNWTALSYTPVGPDSGGHDVQIAAGNGILVTVSQEGLAAASTDGVNWSWPQGLSGRLRRVLFGNGVFVAMLSAGSGDGNEIWTSADGITWISEADQIGDSVIGVSFSDGVYTAITSQRTLLVSIDGSHWAAVGTPAPGAVSPTFAIRGAGLFVGQDGTAGADSQVLLSTDGRSWTPVLSVPMSEPLIFGNGAFTVFGPDTFSSVDGVAWTRHPGNRGGLPSSVAYGNGRFLAVGGNKLLISADGSAWTPVPAAAGGKLPTGIYFANGTFLGPTWPSYDPETRRQVAGAILSSADGVNWQEHAGAPLLSSLRSIVYGNNVFVAIGLGNSLYSSLDAANWSLRASTEYLTKVVFGNGLFLASAYRQRPGSLLIFDSYLYGSSDGIAWQRLFTTNFPMNVVAFGNGVFVAQEVASFTRYILTSPDGITWTPRFSGPNLGFASSSYAAYGAGRFVLAMPSVLMTSADAVTWTELPVKTETQIAEDALHPALAYGNGNFVSVFRGKLLQSGRVLPPYTVGVLARPGSASTFPPEAGEFEFVRSGTEGNRTSLELAFQVSGTAQGGVDYASLPESIVIAAGQDSITIPIVPFLGISPEPPKTVVISLLPQDQYLIGADSSAVLTLPWSGLPQFSKDGVTRLEDGSVDFAIQALPGAAFYLESSVDLQHWEQLTYLVSSNGVVRFTDIAAKGLNFRFYRTRIDPTSLGGLAVEGPLTPGAGQAP